MVIHPEAMNDMDAQGKTWAGMVILSILLHGLFFSGVLFFPELNFRKKNVTSLVEIDLVSLPPAASPERRPASRMAPVPEKKQAPEAPKKAPPPSPRADTVSLAPSKPVQVKRSLKKKTFDASKAINQAISKLEKQAPDSRPQSVMKAINALQKKAQDDAGTVGVAGPGAGIGEMTKKHLELLDIYHVEIWNIIKTNWAYNPELDRGNQTPKAIIIVKIMRDGEIRDIWFEERSGSAYFDGSCLKAVKKSNPLPPLPEGIIKPYHEVGFRFDPREMSMRP